MGRVAHFELPVDDPERAIEFYASAFGWNTQKWDGPMDYWLVMTGAESEPGIDGALTKRGEGVSTVVNTIGVDDADAAMERIQAAGGKLITPKITVPGVGYMAYCLDTEGNQFGIMQTDESAVPETE